MKPSLRSVLQSFAMMAIVGLMSSNGWAHFPWIVLPEAGERTFRVVFSEDMTPDDPDLLARIVDVPATLHSVDGKQISVSLKMSDDSLQGEIPADFNAALIELPLTWGMLERGGASFLLRYRALGVIQPNALTQVHLDPAAAKGPLLTLNSVHQQWELSARSGDAPLANESIKVVGAESAELKTDDQGQATWAPSTRGDFGLYFKSSIAESGKFQDSAYDQVRLYTTVSMRIAEPSQAPVTTNVAAASDFAELPYGITSFGAARLGDKVYVYGGHTGNAHSYWDESQSNELMSLDLQSPSKAWEVVSTGKRLQGLAMVAYRDALICIGGFHARNKEGEEHDLYSEAAVTSFDTKSGQWSDLPALPQGRSSHDAVLIGDTIYVVGGWAMSGKEPTHWHTSALAMDMNAEPLQWKELPAPAFERRALAAAEHQGKLYVIGGMNRTGGPTRDVEIFDPATQSWSKGPAIQGEDGMAGFGAAAWSVAGKLLVSNIRGDLQTLAADGSGWIQHGKSEEARFFHRLLPLDGHSLLSVGGASMESGKFLTPEKIDVQAVAQVPAE